MMVVTLLLVIWTMRSFQSGQPALQTLNDFFSGNWGGDPSQVSVTICPTRVKTLTLANGTVIKEEKMKWLAADPEGASREIHTIGVEKWLGEHCQVKGQKVDSLTADLEPALTLSYVNGPEQILKRSTAAAGLSTPVYQWQDVQFTSPDLDAAFPILETLAQ